MITKNKEKKPIKKTVSKSYKQLGYTKLESAEIVVALDKTLADLHIFNQKAKAFHWNIKGDEFFDLHDQFEHLYSISSEMIDEVAERIRIFGHFPNTRFSKYLELSNLKEHEENMRSFQMVKTLRDDMQILIEDLISVTEAAIDAGDLGSQDLANSMLRKFEKLHWMYSSYVAE